MVPSKGIVLMNFGGPQSAEEVTPFLKRLFSDPWVISLPKLLRVPLASMIASLRGKRIAKEYEKIGFSPLNDQTNWQARRLSERLGVPVWVINRYTAPFSHEVLPLDVEHLFVCTLYPHLSHSTVVSSFRSFDLAGGHPRTTRIYTWHHHPAFVHYVQKKVEIEVERPCFLYSAHGVPERFRRRGDPYVDEIESSFYRITKGSSKAHLAYQSRVGPAAWVGPYTDEFIKEWGKKHPGEDLVLVPLSFTADHFETLYEMDIVYRELALASGFRSYKRISLGGYDEAFIEVLMSVLKDYGF